MGRRTSLLVKEKGVFSAWSDGNAVGKRSCLFRIAIPKTSSLATPWTRIFLLTSTSSPTMCTLPSDPFVEPFYSLKKAFTRLLSPIPESTYGTRINIARSSAPPILITQSSTIHAANIAMPVTSKIFFNLPAPKWTLIAHWIKFAGDQVDVSGGGVVEHSQQILPISSGLH